MYKNQTMTAASAKLSCSFRHVCTASLFPLGNYLFPVDIIILQHAADLSGNTSHFHLQPAGCFPAAPCLPHPRCLVQRSKGQTSFNEDGGRVRGRNDRKEMRMGETEQVGWAQQWKMDTPLHQHPPTHSPTHMLTYSRPPVSLVKGNSAVKNLPSVNDRYLSYSGDVWTDSLEKRSRERQEAASSLSRPIKAVDWQSDIIRPLQWPLARQWPNPQAYAALLWPTWV